MKKPHKRWTLLWVLLLALLCVGAAELTATYFIDPPLYHRITDPVVEAGQAAYTAVKTTVTDAARAAADTAAACGRALLQKAGELQEQFSAWWEEVTAPPPEQDTSQEASEPDPPAEDLTQDPAITQLEIRDDREILTGGAIPVVYFNQGQEPWASGSYGSDPFARYGCGPAVMAMAVSSMTESYVTPLEMGKWAVENGHWAKGGGSRHSLIRGAAEANGLTVEALPERTPDAMRTALLSNQLLVALMGPGHFTKGGHFILLRGVTLSGAILVADPNNLERSLTAWDPQLILDELSSSTADGSPLWVLSLNMPAIEDIP